MRIVERIDEYIYVEVGEHKYKRVETTDWSFWLQGDFNNGQPMMLGLEEMYQDMKLKLDRENKLERILNGL